MKLINDYKTLNADEKDLLHSVLGAIPLMLVFLWFVFTANPRAEKAAPIQKHEVKSYELKGSYVKYAQRVYNEKYGK
jgi:hypothetical protein